MEAVSVAICFLSFPLFLGTRDPVEHSTPRLSHLREGVCQLGLGPQPALRSLFTGSCGVGGVGEGRMSHSGWGWEHSHCWEVLSLGPGDHLATLATRAVSNSEAHLLTTAVMGPCCRCRESCRWDSGGPPILQFSFSPTPASPENTGSLVPREKAPDFQAWATQGRRGARKACSSHGAAQLPDSSTGSAAPHSPPRGL